MTIYTHTGMSAPTAGTVAEFRKWAALVDAMILACGWVQTADTGQSDPAASSLPAASTAAGYRIYSLNDALAGVAPVLLKYEWGRSSGSANMAVWITVGRGSDGAGTITGVLLARTSTASTLAGTTTETASYASGDGSSLNITMWPTGPSSSGWTLRIERSRTLTGEPTGEGLAIALAGSVSTIARTIGYGGTPGAASDAYSPRHLVSIPGTINGISTTYLTTVSLSQDGVTAPVIPVVHVAPGVTPWVSANIVVVASGDAGASSLIIANTHGVGRVFRCFPSVSSAVQCDVSQGVATSSAAITAQVWAEV